MEIFMAKIPGELSLLCLTLGLASYTPPHFIEKLQMLFRGHFARPIDGFDLLFHGVSWLLLVLKLISSFHF